MSTTATYAIYKTKAVEIDEYHNGHGSGPSIWDYISLKCLHKKFSMFLGTDEFWPLWKDQRLDRKEKAVLLSTYDQAIVEVEHLLEFSEACIDLHDRIIKNTDWMWNHFAEIGKTARQLAEKHDRRCIGLGISCTSVCDIWEQWEPKEKTPWGIYAEIDSLEDN